jgi:DnaA-like protein
MHYDAIAIRPLITRAEMVAEFKFRHQRIIAAGVSFEKRARLKLGARKPMFHVCQQAAPAPVENFRTRGVATGSLWCGAHPDLSLPPRSGPSFSRIIAAVAEVAGVPVRDLLGPWRIKRVVHARQVAMYFMRHLKNASFPEIGRRCGGRDHSTAMHGCRVVHVNRKKFAPMIQAVAERLDVDMEEQG